MTKDTSRKFRENNDWKKIHGTFKSGGMPASQDKPIKQSYAQPQALEINAK